MVDIVNQPPDPLRIDVRIVDIEGRPTQEFLRQWNQQRVINVTVDDIAIDLTALQDDVTALEAEVDDIQDVDIVAGVGLDGGGNITGPANITVDLADTAVTPGTYGSATNSAQITVDQQGRITAAANIPITGGGGGSGSATGGGRWIRHGSFTPDSSGVITCTLPSGQSMIRIYADGITYDTNSVELRARFSASGAPVTANGSYSHTSYRQFANNSGVSGDTGSPSASTNSYMALGISNQGNDANEETNFELFIFGADSASRLTQMWGTLSSVSEFFSASSTGLQQVTFQGYRATAQVNDEVLFFPESGGLDGGTIYVDYYAK